MGAARAGLGFTRARGFVFVLSSEASKLAIERSEPYCPFVIILSDNSNRLVVAPRHFAPQSSHDHWHDHAVAISFSFETAGGVSDTFYSVWSVTLKDLSNWFYVYTDFSSDATDYVDDPFPYNYLGESYNLRTRPTCVAKLTLDQLDPWLGTH